MADLTGGCLCGAIRYAFDPKDGLVDYCHCDACRRSTGGVAVAWVQVDPARFRLTAGEPVGYRHSPLATRFHCGTCGAQTHMTDPAGRSVGITLGTLDDREALSPTAHGFDRERPSWLVIADAAPRFPGPPPYDEDDGGPAASGSE